MINKVKCWTAIGVDLQIRNTHEHSLDRKMLIYTNLFKVEPTTTKISKDMFGLHTNTVLAVEVILESYLFGGGRIISGSGSFCGSACVGFNELLPSTFKLFKTS
jgi:hypothetical protein